MPNGIQPGTFIVIQQTRSTCYEILIFVFMHVAKENIHVSVASGFIETPGMRMLYRIYWRS